MCRVKFAFIRSSRATKYSTPHSDVNAVRWLQQYDAGLLSTLWCYQEVNYYSETGHNILLLVCYTILSVLQDKSNFPFKHGNLVIYNKARFPYLSRLLDVFRPQYWFTLLCRGCFFFNKNCVTYQVSIYFIKPLY